MTVHTFPGSRKPSPADGRAKATGADAPVAESFSAAPQRQPAGSASDPDALFKLLQVYERKWRESPAASARGIVSAGLGLLAAVAGRAAAIAYAEQVLASLRDLDGAA